MSLLDDGDACGVMDEPLRKLSRVERVEISIGRKSKVWHPNVMPDTRKTVAKIGFPERFSENVKGGRHSR